MAVIGASSSLSRSPAKVCILNPQPALRLGGGGDPSCPFSAVSFIKLARWGLYVLRCVVRQTGWWGPDRRRLGGRRELPRGTGLRCWGGKRLARNRRDRRSGRRRRRPEDTFRRRWCRRPNCKRRRQRGATAHNQTRENDDRRIQPTTHSQCPRSSERGLSIPSHRLFGSPSVDPKTSSVVTIRSA